jgi:hypothetical protein
MRRGKAPPRRPRRPTAHRTDDLGVCAAIAPRQTGRQKARPRHWGGVGDDRVALKSVLLATPQCRKSFLSWTCQKPLCRGRQDVKFSDIVSLASSFACLRECAPGLRDRRRGARHVPRGRAGISRRAGRPGSRERVSRRPPCRFFLHEVRAQNRFPI